MVDSQSDLNVIDMRSSLLAPFWLWKALWYGTKMHTDILLWNISKQWATSLRSHEMVHILLHKFRIKIILPIYPINYQKKYIFRCFSHTFYIIQQILFVHCPRLYPPSIWPKTFEWFIRSCRTNYCQQFFTQIHWEKPLLANKFYINCKKKTHTRTHHWVVCMDGLCCQMPISRTSDTIGNY